MPKLLVTGGAGYVGSHVVQYLVQEKGYLPEDIIVFDGFVQGNRDFLPKSVICVEGDLRERDDIIEVFRKYDDIDGVIHLAGILNVAESMEQPGMYFKNNVTGGLHLLEAMVESSCRRMVFSSSCTVYGAAPSPVSESDACEPISPYGESKLQFERLLQWYTDPAGAPLRPILKLSQFAG